MKKEIEIKPKKPKLVYIGMDKKTLAEAVPTQVVEVVYPHKADEEAVALGNGARQEPIWGEKQLYLQAKKVKKSDLPKNRLIWTNDNLVALKTMLDEKDPVSGEYRYRNKIDLIYIDPPFMVQNDFVAENSIDIEVDEEEGVMSVKEPTIIETIAYKDTWQNGLDSFLQMMRERLELLKELLAPTGLIYVHLDWHTSHYVKVLMDEIFDYPNFRNEVVWCYDKWPAPSNDFQKDHDVLLRYSKTDDYHFKLLRDIDEKRQLTLDRGYTTNLLKNGERQLIVYKGSEDKENIKELIKSKNFVRVIYKDPEGNPLRDYWLINKEHPKSFERTGYPTQKPIELLIRIIETSCPKNGLVLDAFVGSGTTCKAAEQMAGELNCSWIGIDNSKFAVHTARKRLIELNGKPKGEKGREGVYKVRPFTVENMGYYQRGVKWDPIQVSNHTDAYRQAIIELFGGEYAPYSKLLHGKKKGAWVHIGPLSQPLVAEQVMAIAEEVKETEFKKCYMLSADFTAHLNQAVEKAKEKFGVQVTARIIPTSAIDEVKKRLELIKQGVKDPEKVSDMPNIAFFAPLAVKIHKVIDGKEAMIELSGLEVDAESFLESQKPERRDELKKWLGEEKSWQSFVDFWTVDWDYQSLSAGGEPIFENEWQSFRKRKGKKVIEDLTFKAFNTYEKNGEYTIAVKVTDVFGNDGIVTTRVVIK